MCLYFFFFSSRRRHTRCALVTGVQTCALPIWVHWWKTRAERERGVPMRVLNRSVYVGPSLYAHFPVIRLELDLGALEAWPTAKLGTAFVDTLIEALPGLEIGRAHVCTPVTNAHLVCRLLLEKKKT